MIWYKDKFIVTPPKCASTSLTKYLCTEGGILILGPTSYGVNKHTCHFPYEANSAKIFMVVRQPKERLVSLFNHYCRFNDPKTTVEQFCTYYKNKKLHDFYNLSLFEHEKMISVNIQREPQIIKLEYLNVFFPEIRNKEFLNKSETDIQNVTSFESLYDTFQSMIEADSIYYR